METGHTKPFEHPHVISAKQRYIKGVEDKEHAFNLCKGIQYLPEMICRVSPSLMNLLSLIRNSLPVASDPFCWQIKNAKRIRTGIVILAGAISQTPSRVGQCAIPLYISKLYIEANTIPRNHSITYMHYFSELVKSMIPPTL
jgi:hypothetical protein